MSEITYLDFDLQIEQASAGYRARVLNSPAGQASGEFTLPFGELELENFLLRLGQTRHALVRDVRLADSEEAQSPKRFGQRLFTAVFANEVQACLRSSQDTATRQGARLRLRLHLTDAPELAALPWEYLYHASLKRFLALSAETPVVRYLDLPDLILPMTVTTPLRLLVLIASPTDYPQLDVEQEWARLKAALAELERRGLLVIERVEDARLAVLQQRLRQQDYHILHFIGHGGFDAQTQEGILLLEGQAERGQPVSGQDLGTLLHDHRALRLVVLNACQGGRSAVKDPFAGVAQSLVQQRIPAVVAMQFEITDQAAVVFAQEFYSALADNYPVDAALTEARKAIFAQGNKIEWGTPVLYMRAPDGQLFDVKARNPTQTILSTVAPKPASTPRPLVTQPPAPLVVQPISALQPADKPRSRLRNRWVWGGLLALGLAVLIGARLLSPTVAAPPAALAPTPPTTATLPVATPLVSGPPKRIQFTRGTTSATLKGTLAGAEQRQYTLRALAGQTLTVEATANDASLGLAVQGVSDKVVYKELHQKFEADLGRWQGVLPKTQDYLLTLALGGNTVAPTAYTLHVSIPPLTAQPPYNADVAPTQR